MERLPRLERIRLSSKYLEIIFEINQSQSPTSSEPTSFSKSLHAFRKYSENGLPREVKTPLLVHPGMLSCLRKSPQRTRCAADVKRERISESNKDCKLHASLTQTSLTIEVDGTEAR